MQKCTAAEITEKRRIALEKLSAKKAKLASVAPTVNASLGGTTVNNFSAGTRTTQVELPSQHSRKLPEKSSTSFYNTNAKSTPSASAINFLNDLKKGKTAAYHPYERPAKTTTTSSSSYNKNNFSGAHRPRQPQEQKIAPVFTNGVTCKVYMINASRFAVQTSGFKQQLIDVFKTIPSKSYDASTRNWDFALKDYELLQERVGAMKPDVVIGVIPKPVLNLCRAPPKEVDRSCLAAIEPTLESNLLPFQRDGVCIAQNGRAMICDEMGLGKTYQAIAVADFYRDDWPLLVCTTAVLRGPWSSKICELLPNIPVHYVQVLASNQQYFGDAKVLITSYGLMEKNVSRLLECRFGCVIFDESHFLKNQKAKCTTVAERLAAQAKRVLMLSGTPALSRPLELFSQLHMIDKKFMNFMDFTSRYCDGKQTNFGWDANGQSNMLELNTILKLKFMIRRHKSEVLPELAEKFRETVLLDPALVWQHNEDSKKTLTNFARDLTASKGREKEEILLRFYAQTAEVKTRAVCAYLKTLVKEKIKFIVFAHHRVMMDAITECLTKLKVNFIRIDGSTKNEVRVENIDKFQNKSACQVAVLSLRACNAGITLTAAEMIVFAELDWNPSTLAQAESRAHRIGQDKIVKCRYLMATKTADDVIWNMLKAKQDVLNSAGLFSENLQDATHTAAPTGSHKIDEYFTPTKAKDSSDDTSPVLTSRIDQYFTPVKAATQTNISEDKTAENSKKESLDLNKELENIEAFFEDDDDEAFKDLIF